MILTGTSLAIDSDKFFNSVFTSSVVGVKKKLCVTGGGKYLEK